MRTVRTYQNNYTIACDDATDLYHCFCGEQQMLKKDRKPATYKNLTLAEKFIKANGAIEIVKEQPKKSGLWMPPPAVVIPPLEEQLAALSEDAPRFVVVNAPYGPYKQQGYANYDRQEKRYESYGVSQSWNDVFQTRDRAEQSCKICNENPPTHYEYDLEFAAIIVKDNENDNYIPYHTESVVTPPPAEKEATFVGNVSYQVGDIITDKHGRKYRVTEPSFYLSERDVADMEDANDIFVDAGWHTKAVLVEVE